MKHTTVAILQTMVAMMAIIANIVLQISSYVSLGKVLVYNSDVDMAKKLLIGSFISQIVAILMIGTVLGLLIFKKDLFASGSSIWVYIALIGSAILLLVGGSLGIAAAAKLQCLRETNPAVQKAWKLSSISAVVGVIGAMLMLVIQAFLKKDTIAAKVRQYVEKKPVARQPAPTMRVNPNSIRRVRKATMPVHHPEPFRSNFDL